MAVERNKMDARADSALGHPLDELRPVDCQAGRIEVNGIDVIGVGPMRLAPRRTIRADRRRLHRRLAMARRQPHRTHTYHIYAIHLDPARLAIDRAEFIERMAKRGIGTSVHFIPLHRHPYYAETFGYHAGQFPVADGLYEGLVSLPSYPRMTGQESKTSSQRSRNCNRQSAQD